jgi:hypothetical protein
MEKVKTLYVGPSKIFRQLFGEIPADVTAITPDREQMPNGEINLYGQNICTVWIDARKRSFLIPENDLKFVND